MKELSTDAAIVTETWFQDTKFTDDQLKNFDSKDGIVFFRRDRRTGARSGGVAIFYHRPKISMSRAKIPHSKSCQQMANEENVSKLQHIFRHGITRLRITI